MFGPLKMMGASDYLERCLDEMTVPHAFQAGALNCFLMNYSAIGSVPAPMRGQKPSVFCDRCTV
jgi:hypothetical protein